MHAFEHHDHFCKRYSTRWKSNFGLNGMYAMCVSWTMYPCTYTVLVVHVRWFLMHEWFIFYQPSYHPTVVFECLISLLLLQCGKHFIIMHTSTNILLLALLACVAVVSGQVETVGCFVNGECTQSLFTAVNRTATPEECLQYCQVHKLHNVLSTCSNVHPFPSHNRLFPIATNSHIMI